MERDPVFPEKIQGADRCMAKTLDWNTLFWGNHDQPRIVSRWGCTASEPLRQRSAKMLAAAMYLQRGTPFIYQGEEIGMTNYPFADASQLRDIESLNLLKEAKTDEQAAWAWNGIWHKGRDNARTPMQWDGTANAGFTTGIPWIAVNPNAAEINVRSAQADENSILHFTAVSSPCARERCAQMGRLPDACPGRSAAFCLPPEPCGGIDRRVVQFQRCALPTPLPPERHDPARRRSDRYRICALWLRGRFRRYTENE